MTSSDAPPTLVGTLPRERTLQSPGLPSHGPRQTRCFRAMRETRAAPRSVVHSRSRDRCVSSSRQRHAERHRARTVTRHQSPGCERPLGCDPGESLGSRRGVAHTQSPHLSEALGRHEDQRRDSRERPRHCGRTTCRRTSSTVAVIDSSAAAHEGGNTAPQGAFPPVFPPVCRFASSPGHSRDSLGTRPTSIIGLPSSRPPEWLEITRDAETAVAPNAVPCRPPPRPAPVT